MYHLTPLSKARVLVVSVDTQIIIIYLNHITDTFFEIDHYILKLC